MTPGAELWIFVSSIAAGLIGALAGVGGGILVIPVLTIGFDVDIRLAVGASIVSVIATSSGAAAAYVKDRMTDMRVGMFLELATTTGAVCGALLAAVVAPAFLYVLLGVVLLSSAAMQVTRLGEETPPADPPSALAARLRLVSSYPDRKLGREVPYSARRVPLGFALMWIAGVVSGLLGIGSGVLKVLAMDGAMRLPMKVSSATSNFMIGVTAAASAGIYLSRGDVDPRIAAPVALGVLTGALAGGATATAHLESGRPAGLPAGPGGRGPRDDRSRPGVWAMNPERFRTMVSLVLTVGVAISAALIGAGFLAALAIGWQGSLLGSAPGVTAATTDFSNLPARLASLEPLAISQLGLLVLLATPVARVAASVLGFALEGDRLYTAITLAVLAILLASIFVLR